MTERQPQGGDAVRIAAPWNWGVRAGAEVGDIGVLQGATGVTPVAYVHPTDPDRSHPAGGSIIFRCRSTFRGDGYVSSSGGPGTIFTPLTELRPTKETVTIKVWNWAGNMPGAGQGVPYTVTVPLWDWHPTD